MKKGSETPRCKESDQVVLSLIDHVHRCKADAPLRGISDFVTEPALRADS